MICKHWKMSSQSWNNVLSVPFCELGAFYDLLVSEKGRTRSGRRPVILRQAVPGRAKPRSLLRWPWAHSPAVQTQPHCWAHTHVQAAPNSIICLALSFSFFFLFILFQKRIFSVWAALRGRSRLTSAPLWRSALWYFSGACQLNFFCLSLIRFPQNFATTVGIHFVWRENHQSQHGGDAGRSVCMVTSGGQKTGFCQEGSAGVNRSILPVMLPLMTCWASGHPKRQEIRGVRIQVDKIKETLKLLARWCSHVTKRKHLFYYWTRPFSGRNIITFSGSSVNRLVHHCSHKLQLWELWD